VLGTNPSSLLIRRDPRYELSVNQRLPFPCKLRSCQPLPDRPTADALTLPDLRYEVSVIGGLLSVTPT
jgi:hypothetical protein